MPVRSPAKPTRGRPKGATTFDAVSAAAFGDVVRNARMAAGISREALAHMANLERSHFGKIERGVSQPTLFAILKIARALGCRAGALVQCAEDMSATADSSK